MKETRILLASVLKPINDSRMFWKLGLSLAKLPKTQVQIAGYQAPLPASPGNIRFYPIFRFKRLGLGRVLASWYFLKLLLRLNPKVIILGTHELLLPAIFYKIFRPCQIIYDVRENYYLNLLSQNIYPPVISWVLANSIRLIERLSSRFILYFFLAEKSYAQELPFLKNKYLVLENKYKPAVPAFRDGSLTPGRKIPSAGINLLYSGTISEIYGIYRAIALCNALNQVRPVFRLTIIGYCPQPEVLQALKTKIAGNAAIVFLGGDKLVPHERIVEAINDSHLGLLPYLPHPSTFNCIPTKFYEYMGHSLPVLVQENSLWEKLILKYDAGLAIDFASFNAYDVIKFLTSRTFYSYKDLSGVDWQSEEKKLLEWANKLI